MARNQIKGLTVEIGGDTTNLGKALESVNKKSSDISSELGEINKLLKFDPKNAELLAQRQKVLADAVTNTSEKLEKLKEAEKQVQRQFERGEVSEEQVRALQREIIATEGKLNNYQEEAKKAAKGTKDLGDKAEDTGGAFEGMGGKLANAAKVGIGAVVAGAGAAVGALVASAEATREYRTEMGKLETAYDSAGHSTQAAETAYKKLYSVIGETDQSVEAAQQIALLADSEEDVAQWADLAAGVVGRFGDALQPETFFEAANETMTLNEATGAYVQLIEGAGGNVDEFNEGLAACTTEAEKQAYMLEYTESVLGEASDMYRLVNADVMRANEANEAWTSTMAVAGAAVEPVLTDVKMLGASLLGELMPGVVGVTQAFSGLINGEDGAADKLGEALSFLLIDLLDMVVELLPTVVEAAMTLLTTLTQTLIGMLPDFIETGITVIMAILEGLTTSIPLIVQEIVNMIPRLVEALVTGIPQLIDGAVQLLLAILDAIPLILPPLIEAIPQIVITIIDGLLSALPQLIEGAVQFLLAIVQAIPILLRALLPEVPRIVDTIIDGLLDNLPVLIDGAIELLFGILEAIPEIAAAIYEEMPSIVTSIVDALLGSLPELWEAGGQLLAGLFKGMFEFDIWGAVKKVGGSIIKGFEKVFDMHSPSRVMATKGELIDEGLAVGIEDNADAPINALDKLSEDMIDGASGLNGVALERRVNYTGTPGTASPADGISDKLDRIYQAILNGQVIMLDGKTLVGSTAVRYDTELGQRRVLAERGAL